MTVAQLKEFLSDKPDEMLVITALDGGVYLDVSMEKSGVFEVEYADEEPEEMVVLFPCTSGEDTGFVKIEQNLN